MESRCVVGEGAQLIAAGEWRLSREPGVTATTHTSGECYKGESRHKPRTIVDEDAAIDDGVRGGEMLEYTVQCLAPRTPAPQKTGKPGSSRARVFGRHQIVGDRN